MNYKNLSNEEMKTINGGESIWYWVAYGVGGVVRGIKAFSDGAAAGCGLPK